MLRIQKYVNYVLVLAIGIGTAAVHAKEIAGVTVPEQVVVSGQKLHLNGVGIRSKFFVKIYVGALYLAEPANTPDKLLNQTNPRRVSMFVLYDEVSHEKLSNGWNDGFANNNSETILAGLNGRLKQFNSLFTTVHRGDVVHIDFLPEQGTQVTINDTVKGIIHGIDFQQAVLKVWFGDDPADKDLKRGMLGENNN